jgi:hypothetical protein
MAVRLILVAVFGAIVGFEREQAEKLAGLQTLSLVSTWAALLTVASIFLRVSHVGLGQSGGSEATLFFDKGWEHDVTPFFIWGQRVPMLVS